MIRGWSLIAKRLGVGSVSTVKAYARLRVDPLPVVMVRGVPAIPERHVDEWSARRNGGVMRDGASLERIEGVAAIGARIESASNTVMRLSRLRDDPLPIYGRKGARWTYETAIRDWNMRHTLPFKPAR